MIAWVVEHVTGSTTELFVGERSSAHLISVGLTRPTVRVLHSDGPALVLGSRQNQSIVGRVPDVVSRRSGGGAVWLDPAEQVWVDVLIPVDSSLWDPDVTRSFYWLGAAWIETLRSLGVTSELHMHTDGLLNTPWSSLLCFAGRGPGEVFAGNRKLVGIAQRRGRAGAMFQCGLLLKWSFDPAWFSEGSFSPDLEAASSAGIGLNELLQLVPSHDEVASTLVDVLESLP